MSHISSVVTDAAGRLISFVEGPYTVSVRRDAAGRPLVARAVSPGKPTLQSEFKYSAAGKFTGLDGEFVSSMIGTLVGEATRGGAVEVGSISNPLTGGATAGLQIMGDLNEAILGAGGIRAILAGDSRFQQNIDQTATAITNRARWFTTLNALLGQRFELVNNAGVNGDTAAGLLARIKNSNLGVGFGALGDAGVAAANSPGAGVPTDFVFVGIGTNDIVGAGRTAAETWASTRQVADIVRGSGKTLVLCTVMAPNSTIGGYSTAKMGQLMAYNDLIRDYCRANRGVILFDHFAAAIAPTSASVETAATDLRDGTNHENNRGGYKIAKAGVALFAGLPARQGLLPSSNAATSALDSAIKHLRVNPLLTGTVAITATGYTGNAATGLGNGNFVRGGAATAVLSKVTRADGYGDNLKFVCTFTANNETIEMRDNSYHTQAVGGGKYFGVAEVKYSGPAGANLALADNLKNIQLAVQYTDGGGNRFVYDLGVVTASDVAIFNSETMTLKTPVLELPATLNTPTTLRLVLTITASGAGNPEVEVGRMDLIAL